MNNDTFAGLAKTQFLGLLVTLLVACFAVQAFDTYRLFGVANQGSRAHAAICVLDRSLRQQVQQSEAFLALTVKQREAKYGKSFGDIPPSVILRSITSQTKTIDALRAADC